MPQADFPIRQQVLREMATPLPKEAGHTVTQLRPALVPIATKEEYVTQMQGLALKNIRFYGKRRQKSFI